MGHSIGIYGSKDDTRILTEYACRTGLHVVGLLKGQVVPEDPAQRQSCYLSVKSPDELTAFRDLRDRDIYSAARDPLLKFRRPYYTDPYLVLGEISCSNDTPELYAQTRSHYHRLARWIRKEWSKYGDFYLGPDAKVLFENGAEMINFPPGTKIRYTIIET